MLKIVSLPSPNFSSRASAKVSLLVLHYTGMKSVREALDRLCDRQAKVSAHYVIDEDGTAYRMVDEEHCAWHAGVSYWQGHRNVNNISIGIEIVNPGHEFGYRPFPKAQMEAVAEICKDIIFRHAISADNVVGHSDVAPMRKEDPGELFDWKWLAGQGVGLWPQHGYREMEEWKPVIARLVEYGYEEPQDDAGMRKIITAFQRHFRPSRLDGVWDTECEELLASLRRMV